MLGVPNGLWEVSEETKAKKWSGSLGMLPSTETPRYNWPRIGWRVGFASFLGLIVILAAHTNGKGVWPPPSTCQGGFVEAVVYEIQFIISLLIVEALHWISWFLRQSLARPPTSPFRPAGNCLRRGTPFPPFACRCFCCMSRDSSE